MRVLAVSVCILAAYLISCKREDRGFRVDSPSAKSIETKSLSELYPASQTKPAPTKNEYEENAYALSEGKRLYSSFNCVGCHSHGGGGMGPPLMDNRWIYGSNPEQVFASIVEGRPNGMPAFRGKIPTFEVWQLAAYVRSISGLVPQDSAPGRDDDMQFKPPENSVKKKQPKNSIIPPASEMP
jgi:cytochrome c oxidase cbb3-type subunit 3